MAGQGGADGPRTWLAPAAAGSGRFAAVVSSSPATVVSGHDVPVVLTLTTTGPDPVAVLLDGRLGTVVVVDRDDAVVGRYLGSTRGTGLGGRLEPGGQIEVPLVGGTACPTDSYATPPGDHLLDARIEVRWSPARGRDRTEVVAAPRVPLRVTG